MSLASVPQNLEESPPSDHLQSEPIQVSILSVPLSNHTDSASPPPITNHNKTLAATGPACAVCGDVAPNDSSFRRHYGVICCEACKCFFRRTVQMSRDYKCRFGGSCQIGRSPVNMKQVCQACRFSQCLKAGMKVESVKKFPRKAREDGSTPHKKYQKELKLGKEKEKPSLKKVKGKVEETVTVAITNGTIQGSSPPKPIHVRSPKPESDGEVEMDLEHLKFNVASPESFMYSVLDSAAPQFFNYDSLENIHEKSAGSPAGKTTGNDLSRTASNPSLLMMKAGLGGSLSNLIKVVTSEGSQNSSLQGKRGGADLQSTMQAKKLRLESALSNITPRQPVASFSAVSQNISQPSSMGNSPESVTSACNSQETTPYTTPYVTPMHSPLSSPTKFHYKPSSRLQAQTSPKSTASFMANSSFSTSCSGFNTVNPINLPGFSPQTSNIILPGQPSTIFLNSPFRVVPVAAPPLLPFVQFAPFSQHPMGTGESGKSPFSVVPIPSMNMTHVDGAELHSPCQPDLPTPSLTPKDLEHPRDFDEMSSGIISCPPSGRTSPVFFGRMKNQAATSLPEAELDEVLDSLRLRIRSMFKWAKSEVTGFEDLSPLDQKALLRRTVAELVMVGFARGSIAYDDMLILGSTGKVIRPSNPNSGVATVAAITLRKLVVPLKVLNIDDKEYRLLKEIVVFNPESSGLRNREVVRQYRKRKHIELMEYTEKSSDPGRFGELMCLLTPLFEVSTEVTEQLRLEQFVHEGEARIDALLLMSMINGAEETTESVADA